MGNIVTRFTERFGCKHPFACAGMAFAGMTPDLASEEKQEPASDIDTRCARPRWPASCARAGQVCA